MPDPRSCSKAGGNPGSSDPHTKLLIFTFLAFVFLFITSFGSPFIGWIYFFKVTISDVEVMTFGVFGYCWQYENLTNMCSQPTIGYGFDFFFEASPIVVPITSSPIIKALFLHVLSFTLTAIALPAVALGHFRQTSLFKWTFKTTLFLSLTAFIAFAIDLAFFFSVKKGVAGQATVVIGNGPWLTLTGCILLLLGGCLFKVQSNRISQAFQLPKIQARVTPIDSIHQEPRNVENNPIEDNGDLDLLRQVLLGQANQSQLSLPHNSPNSHEPVSLISVLEGQQASNDIIQTGEDDEATPRPSTSTNRRLHGILVKKTVDSHQPSHSLRRHPRAYAPLSYHTYRSSSVISGQTTAENFAVTRPSSGVPSTASYAPHDSSHQSTMELNRTPSWISTMSRSKSKKARKSLANTVPPALPKRPSISTLGPASRFSHFSDVIEWLPPSSADSDGPIKSEIPFDDTSVSAKVDKETEMLVA